jgi:PAS domain S-box-containing protein
MRLYLTPIRDTDGAIVGTQGIVEDTTERVQADHALRESEERLQLSLQAADLGLWDLDMRTNEIIVNPHWAEMLGYRLEDLAPHIETWQEMTHPDDLPKVRDAVDAHVQHRTPFYTIEYRLRSKSGQWEWVSARGKVVEWNKEGEPLRVAGTHLLITESKQAEQELRQYRDHLEELVQERTTELRRVVNLMAGREVRMAELKETIRGLRAQLLRAGISPVADDPLEADHG